MHKKLREYLILIIILILFLFLILTQNIKCPFNELTGLHCSGCGITRLVVSILRLDFYQAFRYNPLIFIFLICGIIYVLYSLIRYKKIKQLDKRVTIAVLVIAVIFGILRNIPYFEYLAPTVV